MMVTLNVWFGVWTIFENDIAPSNHLREGLQPFSIRTFSSIDVSIEDSLSFYL